MGRRSPLLGVRFVVVACALACAGTLCAQVKPPDVAKPLIGSWRGEDDTASLIRFDADKYLKIHKGRLVAFHARYEPDGIVLNHWGDASEIVASVENGVLSLTHQGSTKRFRRLEKTPPELELKPLPIPKQTKRLKPDEIRAIQAEIGERSRRDQSVQGEDVKPEELSKVYGENTAYLKQTIAKVGWLDAERFGRKTSGEATWMVLHSEEIPLMLAVLPRVEQDVKAKRLDGMNFAYLHDRLQLDLGEKQRFGSQVGNDSAGAIVVLPVEDRKRIDQRRQEVGLEPLARYLAQYVTQNGGKEVAILEDY